MASEAMALCHHRRPEAMNTTERVAALWELYQQLDALLTPDEIETYPALEHLGDLIQDLEQDR